MSVAPIRADVYCDLQRKCTSIRALDGEFKGKVVAKPVYTLVHNVTFRVQAGTLARIRATKVRAVCAFARGAAESVENIDSVRNDPRAVRVHFNPYRGDTFTLDDGTPVHAASVLAIDHKTAFIIP